VVDCGSTPICLAVIDLLLIWPPYSVPDGKICLNERGDLAVTKIAVEPVWYLPGVAARFGIDEGTLRRALFEHTGGSYPEVSGDRIA
jgi:hypothetical protein